MSSEFEWEYLQVCQPAVIFLTALRAQLIVSHHLVIDGISFLPQ